MYYKKILSTLLIGASAFSFAPFAFSQSFDSEFNQLYLRGTFNGWSRHEMTLSADNYWTAVVHFEEADGDFKFDRYGDWKVNWGDKNDNGWAGRSEPNIDIKDGPGNYQITFNDTNAFYEIRKLENQLNPIAVIDGESAVEVGGKLTFTAENSHDVDGEIIRYRWSNGSSDSEATIHFSEPGFQEIFLEVTDDHRQVGRVTKTIWVKPKPNWKRTVVFINADTESGDNVFVRGGLDYDAMSEEFGQDCRDNRSLCTIPIQHNLRKENSQRKFDTVLDWGSREDGQGSDAFGTPLLWTTNDCSNKRFVYEEDAEESCNASAEHVERGFTQLNKWGRDYWLLDVMMDCSATVDGWFEVRSYISGDKGWGEKVQQPDRPWNSGNHFARCGEISILQRDMGIATYQAFEVEPSVVAEAGEDIVTRIGELVALDASASMTVGTEIQSYEWNIPALNITNVSAQPDFTFEAPAVGTFQVSLTVVSTSGIQNTDTLTLDIKDETFFFSNLEGMFIQTGNTLGGPAFTLVDDFTWELTLQVSDPSVQVMTINADGELWGDSDQISLTGTMDAAGTPIRFDIPENLGAGEYVITIHELPMSYAITKLEQPEWHIELIGEDTITLPLDVVTEDELGSCVDLTNPELSNVTSAQFVLLSNGSIIDTAPEEPVELERNRRFDINLQLPTKEVEVAKRLRNCGAFVSPELDVDSSLFVHDVATIGTIDGPFSLRNVFQKLANDMGDFSPNASEELFRKFWATLLPRSPENPQGCVTTFNGFEGQDCPRLEGDQALGDNPATFLDAYKPISLINRFDLRNSDASDCGEYRISYGLERSLDFPFRFKGSGRNLMIFEAKLPNPTPGLESGCIEVQKFWAELTEDTNTVKQEKLVQFYFEGSHQYAEVVKAEHYSIQGGQIRTNMFMDDSWLLKEFRLDLDTTNVLMDTVKNSLHSDLFIQPELVSHTAKTESFQRTFLDKYIDQILGDVINGISLNMDAEDDEFNNGESHSHSGNINQNRLWESGLSRNSNFRDKVEDALSDKNSNLSAEQFTNRLTLNTCAGCHEPQNFGLTRSDSLGQDMQMPAQNFNFSHTDENEDSNGVFPISTALEQEFLPERLNDMNVFLQNN